MYCNNCGKQYEGNFCPDCGVASQNTSEKSQSGNSKGLGFSDSKENNKEFSDKAIEVDDYEFNDLEKVINRLCSIFDIPKLTEDQYRNTIIKRTLAEFLLCVPLVIWLFWLSYMSYKNAGFLSAVIVFILLFMVFTIVCWILGLGKSQKRLDKYDRIKNEVGKEAAVLSLESGHNFNPGCIFAVALVLLLLVLMSFC